LRSSFPVSLAVFGVREYVEDKHALSSVVDARDQPVIIPVDIEYRPSAHNIGMREITPRSC
jgi:hypothetical protein